MKPKLRKIVVSKPVVKGQVEEKNTEFLSMVIEKLHKDFQPLKEIPLSCNEKCYSSVSVYELAMLGLGYLRACLEYRQPMTKTGLAIFCGFSCFLSFKELGMKEEYRRTCEQLLSVVEMYNETALHSKQNPIGSIFILKNMGWADNLDLGIKKTVDMSEQDREEARKRLSALSE